MRVMRLRPRAVTLLAVLVTGGLTELVVLVPSLRFAYRSVPLHAMLETAATLVALLTTFLLWGRLRERRRLGDLLLFVALGVLSLANLFFGMVPAAVSARTHSFSTWTTVAATAVGGALLALAALAPSRQVRHVERATAITATAAAGALGLLAAAVWHFLDRLPAGIDPERTPTTVHPVFVGSGAIIVAQMVIGVFFAAAAYGFTRRAEGEDDELLLWLGAAAAVAAVARVNYSMFPSLYSDWVYTGDALRLAGYVLLFVGAAREIRIYQRAFARAQVVEERRRIARDVHDGLAQELAFIANATRGLAFDPAAQTTVRQIASAAQRGLDESRRAIATLTRTVDEPFEVALVEAVEDVAERLGTRLEVDAEPVEGVTPEQREQLLRIAREAVSNASRHANADLVRVTCRKDDRLRLHVEDDGAGFDPLEVNGDGFGLVAMHERAAAIGADLRVTSLQGFGTSVEVVL
jgi:signal transduction histidine kinase